MTKKHHKPDWVPENAGKEFTTSVMAGVDGGHDGIPGQASVPVARPHTPRRRRLTVDEYVAGVLAGDRNVLGQAITLVESNSQAHFNMGQEVLRQLIPHTGKSIRIGITGVPGAGKSTFIEALGMQLCDQGHKVAVLAVDPSSTVTRGSILGDKTRMELLSRDLRAFIRPSPSSGTLGGVTRKSRETILVCEAAGFDVILVETVGVGQSETTVRSMVDFFLLVMIAGAGDELQGIKKGIMELADALLVNKADGDNKIRANAARADYNRALHYLAPATEGWYTKAYTCSSLNGEGIDAIWKVIGDFRQLVTESGVFEKRRQRQTLDWVYSMVEEHLRASFFNHAGVGGIRAEVEEGVLKGQLPPTVAAQKLIRKFEGH
ncbi:MAG: methylmalonyl Co-A mutase-associated GTPase MeaB [Candidatus Competibacteraceae bacterium]|nr:methylmalonyl Co-A mutase-associated GTPase MeaB [Candidatus Competibacteraceae bacterium]MBK8899234.1 methylmalonyl Co-A mutase-associated GTPase MeaB [Candidatus Competibacteraceae bacterium]MBK8963273.1 methylmalonyl Co-A mutase-associated GTPase MeaB [Candidatus Competibacteraceae bacterium]MBK9952234.1 methylmalonyl Co-A mutase-associated GTPase MeaB [Candidatus Competibacteraceae bacterium]